MLRMVPLPRHAGEDARQKASVPSPVGDGGGGPPKVVEGARPMPCPAAVRIYRCPTNHPRGAGAPFTMLRMVPLPVEDGGRMGGGGTVTAQTGFRDWRGA
jgi:hypothetical protein